MLSITEQSTARNLLSAIERQRGHAQRMRLGNLIKQKRSAMKMSQRALAAKLGLSHSAIAQWELDDTRPDPTRLPVVCAILGIDMRAELAPEDQPLPQFVDDPQELALLGALRLMDHPLRMAMLRVFIGRLGDDREHAA